MNQEPHTGPVPVVALLIPALLGLYLLLASTLYLLHPLSPYDAKRLLQLILVTVVLCIALFSPTLRSAVAGQVSRVPAAMAWALAAFFLLGLLSSLLSAETPMGLAYSLLDVYMLAAMIVLVLVLAACRQLAGQAFDHLAMLTIAFVGLAVGMQELVGVAVAWMAGVQFSYDIALTHFAHPRFYNQFQTWTIPVLAAMPLVLARYRWAGAACVFVLGLHWYILLMTGARGSTLSLVTALLVALALFPQARRFIFKWQASGLALGVVIYLSMFLGPDTGWEPFNASTPASSQPATAQAGKTSNTYLELSVGRNMMLSSGRTRLWRDAADDAVNHPVLGIGPMNFACKGPVNREGSPHNFPLQLLSEWGIPASLIILILAAFLAWRLFLILKTAARPEAEGNGVLAVMLGTAVLAAALHACLSGILITPVSQVTAILICGWLLGLPAPRKASSLSTSGPCISRWLLIVMIAAGLSSLVIARQELGNMPAYTQQLTMADEFWPRFWQAGKLCRLHQGAIPSQEQH